MTSGSAASGEQGRTLIRPAGRSSSAAASTTSAPTFSPLTGVDDDGLTTIVFAAASAGATLCATRLNGELNGVIAATGPIGNRRTSPRRPSPAGTPSSGTISPSIRVASSAAIRNVLTARSHSSRLSQIALPVSSVMSRASSSRRAAILAETACSSAERRCAGSSRYSRKAACASSIARSTSARVAAATRATTSPVYG